MPLTDVHTYSSMENAMPCKSAEKQAETTKPKNANHVRHASIRKIHSTMQRNAMLRHAKHNQALSPLDLVLSPPVPSTLTRPVAAA